MISATLRQEISCLKYKKDVILLNSMKCVCFQSIVCLWQLLHATSTPVLYDMKTLFRWSVSQPLWVSVTESTEDSRVIFCHTKISACHEGSWLLHVWPLLLSYRRRLISMFCYRRRPPRVTCLLAALTSSPLVSLRSALPVFGIGSTSVFFLPASFFNLGWIFTVCRSCATFFDVLTGPPR